MTALTTSVAPSLTPPLPALGRDLSVLVDVTAASAPVTSLIDSFDPTVIKADLSHLVRLAQAARSHGASGVLIGPEFRTASDRKRALDAWLDPAVAARRVGPAVGHSAVPALAVGRAGHSAVISLAKIAAKENWYALDVAAARDPYGIEDVGALHRQLLTEVAAALGVGTVPAGERPRLIAHAADAEQARIAGQFADVVRLRQTTVQAARTIATAARTGAVEAGRQPGEVQILVDVRVVVSADAAAARERSLLLDALSASEAPRPLDAIGDVQDIARILRAWAEAEVADGFVLVPGSLKADVGAVLTKVLPALNGTHAAV